MEIEHHTSVRDPDWDAFLESSDQGRYQQSSMWAQVKNGDGWQVERLVLKTDGGVLGGAQMFWQNGRLGRVGYVSQGPVFASPNAEQIILLVDELKRAVKRLRLSALIVQCPDRNESVDRRLAEAGFLPNRLKSIITATWVTPLTGGIDGVVARMKRETRKKLRLSVRRGVTVREGGAEDLDVFFRLMLETCNRQGVQPNPGSREAVQRVWDAFHPGGHLRMGIADHRGRPVSARISLRFGGRLSFWKKGSDPDCLHLHPMEPLCRDALDWASREGDLIGDFGSLKQATAETLLAGDPLSEEMRRSRDFFNIRFGGHAVLLPEARIYFRNPVIRRIYRTSICSSVGSRLLRKRYQC